MTTGDLTDAEADAVETIEDSDVSFLMLQFTDILGTVKSVTIPAAQAEKAFKDGIYFDGSSIEGFVRIQESDMRLVPDPDTLAIMPWEDGEAGRSARLICDVYNTTTGEPFVGDPRGVLMSVLEEARDMGYSVNVGPEPEFFVFERDESGEATRTTHDSGGYFDLGPKDLGSDLRREIIGYLEEIGFKVESSHHEVAKGQQEISFKYADGLSTADNIATFRAVVRATADMNDVHATFMPKPIAHINGSGMHTHLSLFETDVDDPHEANAFHDGEDEFNLSETAKAFTAGVLEHASAVTAVCNPTVNSYKRLVPGYEAPVYVAWSDVNRSALIRKPAAREPASSRIEVRSPDPTCNPYLALAVLIKAGLDGIEKGLDCPGPVRENIYEFDEETRDEYGIDTLPENLGQAVDALEADDVIMDALGPHVAEKFVQAKRAEFSDYRASVSEWEVDRYLEKF